MATRTFTVEGSGTFPLDMLRYDQCYPARSEDAVAISDTGRRTVRLEVQDATRSWQPTYGRWNSFLWSVTDV